MLDKIEGIVIRETPYKETSKIIDIMTPKYGIIGVIAKGSRSLKSDLRVTTTKLSYGTFHIYYKKDKLSTLKSVDIIDNFKNILTDITKISYGVYLLEISSQVMKQKQDSEIFDLLIASLKKINTGFDCAVITNILELKYLSYLGVEPNFDACSICGSKIDIVTLSPSKGGYVCKNCLSNDYIYDQKTIKLIRGLKYVDINKIDKINIEDKIKTELNMFIDDYYERYTGLYLHTKSFLKNLNKIG